MVVGDPLEPVHDVASVDVAVEILGRVGIRIAVSAACNSPASTDW